MGYSDRKRGPRTKSGELYYQQRITCALSYIEENLGVEVTLADVSKVACFSPFHFHRIFKAFVGDSVSDYIKKRRLTKAAEDLITTKKQIIDIAFDSGFESQEALTRAFERVYQTTPGKYRERGKHCGIFEKREVDAETLRHLSKGVTMEPKVVSLPEFKVVGMRKVVTLKTNYLISKLWEEFLPRIPEIKNIARAGLSYGICEYIDLAKSDENTLYGELVSMEVNSFDFIPEGMVSKVIPAAKYAVFTHKGKIENLQKTYDYIYKTWLPNSGMELAPHDDFELYDYRFKGASDPNSEFDIYTPVK